MTIGFSKWPLGASSDGDVGPPVDYTHIGSLAFAIDLIDLIAASWGAPVAQAVHSEVALRIVRAACDRGLRLLAVDRDRLTLSFEGAEFEASEALAAAIATDVSAMPVTTTAGVIHFTLSAGVATDTVANSSGANIESLALAALQSVQGFGGGHVRAIAADHGLLIWYQRAMATQRRVREALDDGRISLAYQPVVDRDGGVFYHECLLRAVGEAGDMLNPAEFVPVLEQLGSIGWFDHFVFGRVVDELEQDKGAVFGCNISGQSISCAQWAARAAERLVHRPDIAQRLIVEITETAAIFDLSKAAKHVARLRALGVRVALDDFGAGHASFAHLRALGVDIVKLDKSFLTVSPATGRRAEEGVGHLAELLRGMGLRYIVVEGVEDVEGEGWCLLRDHPDISHFQGFGLGAPGTYRAWRFSGPGRADERQ